MRSLKLLFLIALLLIPATSTAQMFSADEFVRRQPINFTTFLNVGFEPVDFEFKGGSLPLGPSSDLSFSNPVFRASIENESFGISMGVAGRVTGLDDRSFFQLGVKLGAPFRLIEKRKFSLRAPLQLSTELTSVQDSEVGDDFQQSTLAVGMGPNIEVRFTENLRISTALTPAYGFSVAAGGFFGGQVYTLESKNQLLIGGILPGRAISLGYTYNFQRFDIEEDRFDYNLVGHRFTIGVSF